MSLLNDATYSVIILRHIELSLILLKFIFSVTVSFIYLYTIMRKKRKYLFWYFDGNKEEFHKLCNLAKQHHREIPEPVQQFIIDIFTLRDKIKNTRNKNSLS